MNFDDVLADIEAGSVFAFSTSYEPNPKPDYLRARDNIMIGWGGVYPSGIVPIPEPREPCGTSYQWTGFGNAPANP